MSRNTALATFKGLTAEDLEDLPCQWRSCHGNSYPLFTTSDVEALVRKKRSTDPKFAAQRKAAEQQKTIARFQSNLTAAQTTIDNVNRKRENPPVFADGQLINKTDAKRVYCLDDGDLSDLPVVYGQGMFGNASCKYQSADLRRVAEEKYGGVNGFKQRRAKYQSRVTKKDLDKAIADKASALASLKDLGVHVENEKSRSNEKKKPQGRRPTKKRQRDESDDDDDDDDSVESSESEDSFKSDDSDDSAPPSPAAQKSARNARAAKRQARD